MVNTKIKGIWRRWKCGKMDFVSWLNEKRQCGYIASLLAREMLLVGFHKVLLVTLLFWICINAIDIDLCSKLCKFADDTKIGHAVATKEEVLS